MYKMQCGWQLNEYRILRDLEKPGLLQELETELGTVYQSKGVFQKRQSWIGCRYTRKDWKSLKTFWTDPIYILYVFDLIWVSVCVQVSFFAKRLLLASFCLLERTLTFLTQNLNSPIHFYQQLHFSFFYCNRGILQLFQFLLYILAAF